jgi:phosphate transport system permease protein
MPEDDPMSAPTSREAQPQPAPGEGNGSGSGRRFEPSQPPAPPEVSVEERRMHMIATSTLPSWWLVAVFAGAALLMGLISAAVGFTPALMIIGTVLIAGLLTVVWSGRVEGRRRATDRFVTFTVASAFAVAVTPLVSLLYTVVSRGLARFDSEFFTVSMRGIISEGGGAYHAILGTLIITGVATLAAVPIGVMCAIYLQEYGTGRLKRAITFFVDVMTGIPSIVAGLFAFAAFALFLGPGIRLGVMGSVALAVLMIPIVVRSTEEMLRIVPMALREASYALGVPKWRTIVKVVLPTALAGIVTGVMLSIARIIGETAPLLITTGVFSSVNVDPFNGRMQNLAVFAFNEYKSPGVPPEPSFERAWAAALTLILIVMVLNIVARLVYRRYGTELR